MAFSQKNINAKGGQFRLVKFFSYASILILMIFSFPFSVVISQNAKEMMMKSYENYAYWVGQNLNHQVFQNFSLPIIARYGQISLRDENQYKLMDRVVKNTIHGFKIDLVNIYSIGQSILAYSTDPRLIGKKAKVSLGYKKAIKGEYFSGFVSGGDDPWGLGIEIIGAEKKLRTYFPFKAVVSYVDEEETVFGVFEIIQDLSNEYKSIVKFQYLIFGLSILIMGLIFLALLLIVHKAEKIIDERAKEQRELEAQLHQSERLAALGQMCAGVSHEIRNPLGIIRSTAELLSGMPDAKEAQKKLSSVIIEESGRLNNVVTEFLDFARPMEPNLQLCYLNEIIEKNLLFLRPELDKRKISIKNNLNGRSLQLMADPDLLYRVVLNIFINAMQSMGSGGTISVNVSDERNHYLIEIEDTGCGISKDDTAKIFDPFFTTKDKGSGLGLSIVRNIIEGHNGAIWIESEEGLCTKVSFKLPKGN